MTRALTQTVTGSDESNDDPEEGRFDKYVEYVLDLLSLV
jgi:hypothetical protein